MNMNIVKNPTPENLAAAAEAAWVTQLAKEPFLRSMVAQYTLPLIKKAWMIGFLQGAEVILRDVKEVISE